MNKKYEIGESVVNRLNLKKGTVVDAQDTNDNNITENVKVKYDSGETEWVSTTSISQMLTETNPTPNTKFISE
tara:strand:- start:343 stop:561 length:219 start_codon:yes stop_codon:yes gene_type:complete